MMFSSGQPELGPGLNRPKHYTRSTLVVDRRPPRIMRSLPLFRGVKRHTHLNARSGTNMNSFGIVKFLVEPTPNMHVRRNRVVVTGNTPRRRQCPPAQQTTHPWFKSTSVSNFFDCWHSFRSNTPCSPQETAWSEGPTPALVRNSQEFRGAIRHRGPQQLPEGRPRLQCTRLWPLSRSVHCLNFLQRHKLGFIIVPFCRVAAAHPGIHGENDFGSLSMHATDAKCTKGRRERQHHPK